MIIVGKWNDIPCDSTDHLYGSICEAGVYKRLLNANDQIDFNPTKVIWTVQNHFGLIEGQGIKKQRFSVSVKETDHYFEVFFKII